MNNLIENQDIINLLSLNNSNIFDFIGAILGIIALMFGYYTYMKQRKLEFEKEETLKKQELKLTEERILEQNIENYIRLKTEYRNCFYKLTLFPSDNKLIYTYNINEITDPNVNADEVQAVVFEIIDILKDVYYISKLNKSQINNGPWEEHFYYVFNPAKPIFITAFNKKVLEYESFNSPQMDNFVTFVKTIINENQKYIIQDNK